MYKNFILTESEKETILNMHKDSGYGKPLNGSMEQPVDELDHAGFHDRDDLQVLRDSIDRNKMVSVAFVKKDGSVRHMLIRKSLKSSVFSDAPKTDAQKNIQSKRIRDADLIKAVSSDKTWKEIACELGVTISAVRFKCDQLGIKKEKLHRHTKRLKH